MKTKYENIAFSENERLEKGKPVKQEHPCYDCVPPVRMDYHSYGYITWSKDWDCYRFEPGDNLALTWVCLTDIADFLKQLNAEKK